MSNGPSFNCVYRSYIKRIYLRKPESDQNLPELLMKKVFSFGRSSLEKALGVNSSTN
jgi:hypothetical protein